MNVSKHFLLLLFTIAFCMHAEKISFDHQEHHADMHGQHHGQFGPYPMNREAGSGTSWQPDSSPALGIPFSKNYWHFMGYGILKAVADYQSSKGGDNRLFSSNMLMFMGQTTHQQTTVGFHSMISLEPFTIGNKGYPLLLQTGETANGITPLINRQHPHNLWMELGLTGEITFHEKGSLFAYLAYPGEPALGPPVFMNRFSGLDIPQAPITHHFFDSTHISFGVFTAGIVWDKIKLETSLFTGREPDQHRWGFNKGRFDSPSVRLSYNPGENWSLQLSYGHLVSPEQLSPLEDQNRLIISAIYNKPLDNGNWQTTIGWALRKTITNCVEFPQPNPSHAMAVLCESTAVLRNRHHLFVRYELAQKDDLIVPGCPCAGEQFTVQQLIGGYIFDFAKTRNTEIGLGIAVSVSIIPKGLQPIYGAKFPPAWLLFGQMAFG